MNAILRSVDAPAVATTSPFGSTIRRLLYGLRRVLDRLAPRRPEGEDAPPPEFYRFPPF